MTCEDEKRLEKISSLDQHDFCIQKALVSNMLNVHRDKCSSDIGKAFLMDKIGLEQKL